MSFIEWILLIGWSFLMVSFGYSFGKYEGSRQVNETNANLGLFYKNMAVKQSKQIEQFNNRLEYFTVGEIHGLCAILDAEDYDEDQPVLGIMLPIDESVEEL